MCSPTQTFDTRQEVTANYKQTPVVVLCLSIALYYCNSASCTSQCRTFRHRSVLLETTISSSLLFAVRNILLICSSRKPTLWLILCISLHSPSHCFGEEVRARLLTHYLTSLPQKNHVSHQDHHRPCKLLLLKRINYGNLHSVIQFAVVQIRSMQNFIGPLNILQFGKVHLS